MKCTLFCLPEDWEYFKEDWAINKILKAHPDIEELNIVEVIE